MNQITFFETEAVESLTERQQLARAEHLSIISNARAAAANMINCCHSLKRIKDEKLYIEFGFENFEDYTMSAHKIGLRQAYNLISIAENNSKEFLQANAHLELTKLIALSSLPEAVKADFVENNEVAEMSTRELSEEVKKLKAELASKTEQISMLSDTILGLENDIEADSDDEYNDSDTDVVSEEMLAEIRAEAERTAATKYENMLDSQIRAAEVKGIKSTEMKLNAELDKLGADSQKVRKENEKLAKDLEEAKASIKAVEEYKLAAEKAEAEKQKLEKQIQLSADPALAKFKFLFEALQTAAQRCVESYLTLEGEVKNKMSKPFAALMSNILREAGLLDE